jgi:hypothetical protein
VKDITEIKFCYLSLAKYDSLYHTDMQRLPFPDRNTNDSSLILLTLSDTETAQELFLPSYMWA